MAGGWWPRDRDARPTQPTTVVRDADVGSPYITVGGVFVCAAAFSPTGGTEFMSSQIKRAMKLAR